MSVGGPELIRTQFDCLGTGGLLQMFNLRPAPSFKAVQMGAEA